METYLRKYCVQVCFKWGSLEAAIVLDRITLGLNTDLNNLAAAILRTYFTTKKIRPFCIFIEKVEKQKIIIIVK